MSRGEANDMAHRRERYKGGGATLRAGWKRPCRVYCRTMVGPRATRSPSMASKTALMTWGDVSKMLGQTCVRSETSRDRGGAKGYGLSDGE